MRTPAMIPTREWSSGVSATFNEAAGISQPEGEQKMLCLTCVQSGNRVPPASIVMQNGTSLCAEHV